MESVSATGVQVPYQQELQSNVQMAVLKKSMEIEQQSAAALIQALPEAPKYNNPSNLGQSVDVRA